LTGVAVAGTAPTTPTDAASTVAHRVEMIFLISGTFLLTQGSETDNPACSGLQD
jgi:hypothetical protein